MKDDDEDILKLTSSAIQPTFDEIIAVAKQRGISDPDLLWSFFDKVIKAYKEKRMGCRN